MFDITVVVPTYNRRKLLRVAIDSLRQQSHPADRYEILIISDGSTDGTDDDYRVPLDLPLTRLIRQEVEGFGLSAARNLGTREAKGRLVMFFDDDMVADKELVKNHVEAHQQFDENVAVCGRVKLAAELPNTPFCQIVLGDICRLFAENEEEARFLSYHMALSWQTSFKRSALERVLGYDETFQCYGWEDIEFSYRATQQGLRFFYEPKALSYHNDRRNNLPSHAARVRNAAQMAPVLFARHATLKTDLEMYQDKMPIDWKTDNSNLIAKKAMRQIIATPPMRQIFEISTPIVESLISRPKLLRRWYYNILSNYMLIGYREGLAMEATGADAPQTK